MKKILAILFILCFVTLPVSAKKRQSETVITPMKQLQKREYQTRTFNSHDKDIVMKSLLNVYQDEGFIVYNANSLLGFIYGAKDFDISDSETDISKEFGLTKSRLNFNGVNVATVETTANITQYGDDLKVRINFKRKLLNTYGTAQFIDDINDEEYYNEFFIKLEKSISLLKKSKSPEVQPPELKDDVQQKILEENQEPVKPAKHEKKKKQDKVEAPAPIVENTEVPVQEDLQTEQKSNDSEENQNITEEETKE